VPVAADDEAVLIGFFVAATLISPIERVFTFCSQCCVVFEV
jgi:hypothetical protein